jgi:PIN like domain
MRILLDEHVPIQALDLLTRVLEPHEVDHVHRIRWRGKQDLFLFGDAAARGYHLLLTNDRRQLSDPHECDALKRAGIHHVRYEQGEGLRGLALAVAAILAAMPDVVDALENESGQRLVRIVGLRPTRRSFEVIDPQREPPAYWPR